MRLLWRPRIDIHRWPWDRTWWAKLRDTLRGGVQQQVTLLGILFSCAIVVIGVAAFLSGNNLIFLLLSAMLAAMLVSGFISRLSLSGLRMRFLLPEHISARSPVQGRITVHNEKSWMPTFSLQLTKLENSGADRSQSIVYFPCLPGGAELEAPIDLVFPKRGTQHDNRFLFASRFPFGFTERRIEVPLTQEILIYPCLDPRPAFEDLLHEVEGEIESHDRGLGYDFYRIRPYVHGESARHVDWKATARTGAVQVREFSRNRDIQVDIFLDLDSGGDDEWFEKCVECSAFLSWRLTAKGIGVTLRTQEFEYHSPTDGDVYGILRYLAVIGSQQHASGPALSHERDRYQIFFTADPKRVCVDAQSNLVRVVDPERLDGRGATNATSTTG